MGQRPMKLKSERAFSKVVKRRTHKERAQPGWRSKLGLLEKHKDYVQRARDFHKKDDAIKKLKEKAEQRNPDEFYFAMEKSRTKEGIHVVNSAEAKKYTQEQLALMRTQDVNYLSLKSGQEMKKIERLQRNLHFVGVQAPSQHTVFVDSAEEARKFDPSQHFDTPEALLSRAFNRVRSSQLEDPKFLAGGPAAPAVVKKAERHRLASYRELAQRAETHDKIRAVADRLELQKKLSGKGGKGVRKIVVGGEKSPYEDEGGRVGGVTVYKWRKARAK